jgi:hypothetical protein
VPPWHDLPPRSLTRQGDIVVDRHTLATPDMLQSFTSYESILLRVRTVTRLVQDRIRHTITEYELTPPQGLEDVSAQWSDRFRDQV